MTIYAPTPILTASEKRLLHLISHLLLESAWKASPQSNLLGDEIALSPSESKELLRLLRELFDSKEFQESLFFVEAIASRRAGDAAKRIFLNRRKEIGKSRALSSIRWAEFLHRMGIGPAIPWGPTSPMDFDHFLKMESKLFAEIGTNIKVRQKAMSLVTSARADVEEYMKQGRALQVDQLKRIVAQVQQNMHSTKELMQSVPERRLYGLFILVSNCSTLFTTRDWSVAGTISSIASSVALSLSSDK